MNADIAFFVNIGFVPINKPLYVQGVGHQSIQVMSLFLDPWLFKLPGFGKLFHTHLFAPRDVRQTFMGEGYRMLSKSCVKKNIKLFFNEQFNLVLEKMDRRSHKDDLSRLEQASRKRLFLDHFTEMHEKEIVTLDQVEKCFYEPFPEDFPMERYLCIKEYRYQQYLRFVVGLRFLSLAVSYPEEELMYNLLEHMCVDLQPRVPVSIA